MTVVLWKDLLEKTKGKIDINDSNSSREIYTSLPESVRSIEYGGKRIVYFTNGNGKKILDFDKNNQWQLWEREDGEEVTWYPAKLDSEGREILRSYYAFLKNLA